MPFTVEQLIESHQKLITATPQETAQDVLEKMIEHDFSQIPVVDENNRPLGIVTSDSILRALNNFGIPLADLQVSHAIVKVRSYSPDDDLFDLLNSLKDRYAVLITDNEHKLTGIVTSYDTTEYFRRRAEDTMYVEDIESIIKDFISIAFDVDTDVTNQRPLETAIIDVTSNDIRNKFQRALNHYLNLHDKNNAKVNQNFADEVFSKHFVDINAVDKKEAKELDDLTLYEYIRLLLHKSKKHLFVSIFSLKAEAIDKLLDEVRKTRNDLMHFRGEISAKQREQLHFCAQWLENHRMKVLETFPSLNNNLEAHFSRSVTIPTTAVISSSTQEITQNTQFVDGTTTSETVQSTIHEHFIDELIPSDSITQTVTSVDVSPLDETIPPDDSRYTRLAIWLQNQRSNQIPLSFKQIEEIIEDNLPPSARKHRAWWSNSSLHVQAYQWLNVGWSVSIVSMTEEKVIFFRSRVRVRLYNDFFRTLYAKLEPVAQFPLRANPISNRHWMTLAKVPEKGQSVASLGFSFARKERFRVELYIDTGDQEKNKQIFDALHMRKDEILTELGTLSEVLKWERIDDKRASRIALYHEGSITDTENELAKLREWAVNTIIPFQRVMEHHVSEVTHDL